LSLGMTQTKFAQRIAIATSYLAGMELGAKKVNERIIRLVVAEFAVNEHWFRTGDGEMYDETADVNLAKITSLFKMLTPAYQDCALIQLNALAELQNIGKTEII
ncbi:MAG: hypothetical protein LBC86_00840, partial [Oscillospiraceae bacterium]|nr:hypothetical protein [Oscillospiraceae bacterium]